MSISLEEIAQKIQAEIRGDKSLRISTVATLEQATQEQISFFHNPKYRQQLLNTKAGAVIVTEEAAAFCPVACLVVKDPYFAYAKVAELFAYQPVIPSGIHPTAVVGKDCQIDPSVSIGPYVVIGDRVTIAAQVVIGAGVTVGDECQIGEGSQLAARCTLYHQVILGKRVSIFSGAVIGADGFGHAMHAGKWHKVPQLGRVVLHDDVEIGANTTIDRGTIGNTVIHMGTKIDNQVQIGHNVEIGPSTVIAACVGVAGSTKVGAYCMIGGGAGIGGHIKIADKTVLTGMAMVTNTIKESGVYSSGTGCMPNQEWRKNAVRFRQLDKWMRRFRRADKEQDMENTYE